MGISIGLGFAYLIIGTLAGLMVAQDQGLDGDLRGQFTGFLRGFVFWPGALFMWLATTFMVLRAKAMLGLLSALDIGGVDLDLDGFDDEMKP